MILLSVFSVFISNVKTDNQTIFARSYVVMEQNSGKLLESKDCNLQRSVASVSKIMTAIIALESDKLFNAVAVDDEIDTIVVGKPLNMNGTATERVEVTNKFIHKLKCKYNKIKIDTMDERLTTVEAHRTMNDLNINPRKKKNLVDTISAVYILEMYMNRNK